VTRLSDPHHESQGEHKTLGTLPPQPWPGQSSVIRAGYQSMGFGTLEHRYVVPDYVPTIIACGKNDRRLWADWPALMSVYEKQGVNHLALAMLEFGHTFPSGYDQTLNIDRYEVCHTFFDRYLKVKENPEPAVLYVKADSGVITVHFAPEMNAASVRNGVEVLGADGRLVEGIWEASLQDTRYEFKPSAPALADEEWTIVVKRMAHDRSGRASGRERSYKVMVSGAASAPHNQKRL
jgi:hypothetical protein